MEAGGRQGGWAPPGPQEDSAHPRPGVGRGGSGFLPALTLCEASLCMRLSGQIWVAELKPIISFAPASSVLSGELLRSLPSFSCRRRFVAAAQGVFLKAAAAGSCLSLGWPLPGLARSSLWLHFFFSIKTRGEMYLDPLVCPGLSREQEDTAGVGVPEASQASAPPVSSPDVGRGTWDVGLGRRRGPVAPGMGGAGWRLCVGLSLLSPPGVCWAWCSEMPGQRSIPRGAAGTWLPPALLTSLF